MARDIENHSGNGSPVRLHNSDDFRPSPLFDFFVDRHKNHSTGDMMAEATHKTLSTCGALATAEMLRRASSGGPPLEQLTLVDESGKVFKSRAMGAVDETEVAKRCGSFKPDRIKGEGTKAALKGLKLWGGAALLNTALDQTLLNDRAPDVKTTTVDMLAPLVLLTNLNPRLKIATMVGSHVLAKCGAPVYHYDKHSRPQLNTSERLEQNRRELELFELNRHGASNASRPTCFTAPAPAPQEANRF